MVVKIAPNGDETVYPDSEPYEVMPGRHQTVGRARLRGTMMRVLVAWDMRGDYNERASTLTGRVIKGDALFTPVN